MSVVTPSVRGMASTSTTPGSAAALLAGVRADRAMADAAEARILAAAAAWVDRHPVESIVQIASVEGGFGENPLAVAGPGAPWVAEFAVAEFAAALAMSTAAGKTFLGHAVELRHRLPRTWARVMAGDLPGWRARRIAEETIRLSIDGAAFVDVHVAPVAHRIRPAAVDRLVEEAAARFSPLEAEDTSVEAASERYVRFVDDQPAFTASMRMEAKLDLADALDLDQAIAQGAATLKELGCADPLEVRRAAAVGEIARRQLALDLSVDGSDPSGAASGDDSSARPRRAGRTARRTVLYVHLSEAALGLEGHRGAEQQIARVENTRAMVTADQVRAWCGQSDTKLVVQPVIDLQDQVRVDQWEVPDRMIERVALRDGGCIFPFCSRPARRCRPDGVGCDGDHITPYSRGGPTACDNIAPLCRRHHRLKTHSPWRYVALEPATYLWTSPHGYSFIVDHEGTRDVSRDRAAQRHLAVRPAPDPPPD
jgi:HNH endonuclease